MHNKNNVCQLFVFDVFTIDISNFNNSSQSCNMLSACSLEIYSVSRSISIQNSVSLASFSAIFIFALNSGFDIPRIASLTLAPMLVPLRSICLPMV